MQKIPAVGLERPLILNPRAQKTILRKLLKKRSVKIVDTLGEDKKELALVENPKFLRDPNFSRRIFSSNIHEGVWINYPWSNTLVHTLSRADFARVRLSRNSGFIDEKEQKKLSAVKVGIVGLNVGNPGALCLTLTGVENFKLADNDILSLSNLNRFRAGLPDLGLNKAVLTARQVFETNPFAKVEVWGKGVALDTIDKFLVKPKIDILVEEMDNLGLKIAIRRRAAKYGVPVVMVTGNGSGLILDVERFDQRRPHKLLNGYLSEKVIKEIESEYVPSLDKKVRLLRDFMGKKFLEKDLQRAFSGVGSKLAGIPQLAEASFVRGTVLGWAVRRVIAGKLASGRYHLKLEDVAKTRQ